MDPKPSSRRDTPLDQLSDEELARRTQAGSSACFGEVVRRHGDRLLRFLIYRTRSVQDAEDLLQDTFARAYQRIESYDPRWKLTTWLYTIAARLAYSLRRRPTVQPLLDPAQRPASGQILNDVPSRQPCQWVTPFELLVAMRRHHEVCYSIVLDFEIAFPFEFDAMFPTSPVRAATDNGVAAGDMGTTGDADLDRFVFPITDTLCPKLPRLEIGLAANLPATQRIHIELTEIGVADDRGDKRIGNLKTLVSCVGESFGEQSLHLDRNFKAGFEIVLLKNGIGQWFSGFIQSTADHATHKRSFSQGRFGGTSRVLGMAVRNSNRLAGIFDVVELTAWKPHVTLGRHGGFCIGVLGVALQAMVEKLDNVFIAIEHQHPVEYLAVGVGHTDSLRSGFGATDLTVEQSFETDRWLVDQAGFQGDWDKICLDATSDFGI